MSDRVTITSADLRRAVADERYWNPAHPEREAYTGWVTDNFKALHGPGGKGGSVEVRAYTRTRKGVAHDVAAHTRGNPDGLGEAKGEGEAASADGEVIEAQAPFFLFGRTPFVPPPPRVGPGRQEMRRIPNQSGKEAASNIPDWARGYRRFVDETPSQFARRLMDQRFGAGRWRRDADREADFRKIQKFGQRGFEMPGGFGVLPSYEEI